MGNQCEEDDDLADRNSISINININEQHLVDEEKGGEKERGYNEIRNDTSNSSNSNSNSNNKEEEKPKEKPLGGQQQEEEDDDEGGGEVVEFTDAKLTENSYSIIYVANPKDRAFYGGIFLFFFQISLPILALLNLIDIYGNNILRIPVDVDKSVHAAGYFTLILSVPYFPDLLDSIERFHLGYSSIVLKQNKHATYSKWFLSAFLQFLSGLLFQFVIFILVVQSTDVIGMLLNFAALAFITEIDDVAFSLQDRGYFSKSMKEACEAVKHFKTPKTSATKKGPWLRRIVLLLLIIVQVVGYTVIKGKQNSGTYSCKRIEVQFGDYFWSRLTIYSGIFFVDHEDSNKMNRDGRLVYVDERSLGQTAMFRYCLNDKAWKFGLTGTSSVQSNGSIISPIHTVDDDLDKLCESGNWISKSPETESYDIVDLRPMDWRTKRAGELFNDLTYPVDHFYMSCLDCNNETCNVIGGTCEIDSITGNEYCKCKEGFLGSHCQYSIDQVCDFIDFDHRYDPFPFPTPSRFELAKDENGSLLENKGKPVYAYVYPEDVVRGAYTVSFQGRRFLLSYTEYGKPNTPFENSTEDTIVKDFVAFVKQLQKDGYKNGTGDSKYMFVSEPLDIGTPKDKITPTDISWFSPKVNEKGWPIGVESSPVTTRLLCGTCNPKGRLYCDFYGQCNNNNNKSETTTGDVGQCVCEKDLIIDGDGYVGPTCESYVSNLTQWDEDQKANGYRSSERIKQLNNDQRWRRLVCRANNL